MNRVPLKKYELKKNSSKKGIYTKILRMVKS